MFQNAFPSHGSIFAVAVNWALRNDVFVAPRVRHSIHVRLLTRVYIAVSTPHSWTLIVLFLIFILLHCEDFLVCSH